MKAKIFSIQKFCTHDGPGIRTTVFFAGCVLNCIWCHNPEGKTDENRIFLHADRCIGCGKCISACTAQIFANERKIDRSSCNGCGECVKLCPTNALENTIRETDTDEILNEVLRDKCFYGTEGGITVSGGEPLMQIDAVYELLSMAKKNGITTTVETSGAVPKDYISRAAEHADLFLWDIKDTDSKRLKANTGAELDMIIENIRLADSLGAKIRLRCILLHGINTTKAHAERIKELACTIKNLDGIDLIKYHPMGQSKNALLGIDNKFDSREYIPTVEDIQMFKSILFDFN